MSIPRRSLSPYTHTHTHVHILRARLSRPAPAYKRRVALTACQLISARDIFIDLAPYSLPLAYTRIYRTARASSYILDLPRATISRSLSRSLAPRASKQLDRIKRGGPLLALFSDPKLVNSLSAPMRGSERESRDYLSCSGEAVPYNQRENRLAFPASSLLFSV